MCAPFNASSHLWSKDKGVGERGGFSPDAVTVFLVYSESESS
jgi:hypothetical protein